MKKLYLTFLSCLILKLIPAQAVSPQVIATSGGFAAGANLSVSYTVGESAVTTASGGSNILTQGFQQPSDIISGLLDIEKQNAGTLSLYPVPATTKLWFGYMFNQAGKIEVQLYNVLGQPLNYSLTEHYISGKVIHQLDCNAYAAGNYFLKASITTAPNTTQAITKQFQIIH
ncbi:MAG: T9SS type A sorting domain-containing protein [Chitinophagales bacterium]|nr:T9SS type A sorting domain-containing protein [Chitinophagales bacterium]